jgi:hypothetical protein
VTVLSKTWVPTARLLGLRFRIPVEATMPFSRQCCVLSVRDLCIGLIARPEVIPSVACLKMILKSLYEEVLATRGCCTCNKAREEVDNALLFITNIYFTTFNDSIRCRGSNIRRENIPSLYIQLKTKVILIIINLFITSIFICFWRNSPQWPEPPHSQGFYIAHYDAPQSVGLL